MKSILAFLLLFTLTAPAQALDLGQIEKDVAGQGVEGWVHGADEKNGLYVLTIRNPKDFFDYAFFSLMSPNLTLHRHDRVRVKGRVVENPSKQRHIEPTSVEVLEEFDSPYGKGEDTPLEKLPEELRRKNSETFLVHAIGEEGAVLVVEYKDLVIPVYVKNPALTKDLSRNSVIKMAYRIQGTPDRPVHLRLDETTSKPIETLEDAMDFHGKTADIKGRLILFPKSPEINQNVFAVEQVLESGLKRQFTLANFADPKIFKQIREKLQEAFDRHAGSYENARNKKVSKCVLVRARGKFNQIDVNQANVQILLGSAKEIEVIDVCRR